MTIKTPEELSQIQPSALSKAGRDELASRDLTNKVGQPGRLESLTTWRAAMQAEQHRQEKTWEGLRNAVQALVGSVALGDLSEAQKAGREAVGYEIQLRGNSEHTSKLLDSMGVEI